MKLHILVSKKGTKVVLASELYMALELPKSEYSRAVKKWIRDFYNFQDGIRQPEYLKDFAKRPGKDKLLDDYYLGLELAKLITLHSKSKHKLKFASYLQGMQEEAAPEEDKFTKEQVLAVLELAKVMGLVSCQMACERKHLELYETRNGGSAANWWSFRAGLLGYSSSDLKKALQKAGKKVAGKTQRQMLMHIDKYEMVRTAVIDLFMALGKSEAYAKNVADLAKAFARELNEEIFDDRDSIPAFLPEVNAQLVDQVRNLEPGRQFQLWEAQKMAS